MSFRLRWLKLGARPMAADAGDIDWLAVVEVGAQVADGQPPEGPEAAGDAEGDAEELAIAMPVAGHRLPHPRRRNQDQHRLAAALMRERKALKANGELREQAGDLQQRTLLD